VNAWLERLTGLWLLDPWLLMLVLAVPLALWLRFRRPAPAVAFAMAALLPHRPAPRARVWTWTLAVEGCGLLLAAFALARPVERTQIPHQRQGIDILLCLDLSSSMAATDLDPQQNRLQVAKAAAVRFIDARRADRIGLLCFARYPDLRCPLTLDHAALQQFVDRVSMVANDSPEDATGIGTALCRAAAVLRASQARSKVVVLLTDGEENVATAETPDEIAPMHAAQLCQQLGIRVYTIAAGIGDQDSSGRFQPIDHTQLQRVAALTGGGFFAARDASALAAVYERIDALEKVELSEPRYRVEERFLPFLLAGIALVLVSGLLRRTALAVLP
jgi:Ca-activated chloride channel family protein